MLAVHEVDATEQGYKTGKVFHVVRYKMGHAPKHNCSGACPRDGLTTGR